MRKQQHGFTIVELLIATTVFSVIMVLCLAAFLRVGQLYYKGIYLSRTQEAARNISDDISNQLRLNGGGTGLVAVGGGSPVYYMCAGNMRYSFMSNNVVDTSAESISNYGLVRDSKPSGGCASPLTSLLINPVELLNDKMRVVATGTADGQSDINNICNPIGTRTICKVNVHIDFGDNDLLIDPNLPGNDFTNPARAVSGGTCSGPLQGSQFCATSDLKTSIYPLQ